MLVTSAICVYPDSLLRGALKMLKKSSGNIVEKHENLYAKGLVT